MALDTKALAAELAKPRYDGMSNAAATAEINAIWAAPDTRTKNRDSMSGDELFAATDTAEFTALTEHKQLLWLAFCGRGSVDPFNAANVAFVNFVFGDRSKTVAALADARVEEISRAVELFKRPAREGDVARARAR